MTELNMDSKYNPKEFEDKIYDKWMENNSFKTEVNKEKEPFTIVLPPPNITGKLHMGHGLDQTLQDVLIRWKRLEGYEALWLPGTDHASIATEVKVLQALEANEGITKDDLTREEFLEHAWKWRDDYGRQIVNQMKKLGSSCDWDRERFTMDEGCNKAVTEVFIKLYEKDLIYKGYRLINWCPDCKTTLSDAEVEHEDKPGNFWHINYKIVDSDEVIEIATTRPETIIGDTAIAVNPTDERYMHLIGKKAIVPLIGREIPIVGDDYVSLDVGTGGLKVTPAHDPNDFEIGKRHNLEEINIFNEDATVNASGGKYQGMDRFDARKELVKDLEDGGYLVKVVDNPHSVGTCYRCHNIVEPRLSDQWFVKMDDLAGPAIKVVEDGDIKIIPERLDKVYYNWLNGIRDWCVSRQLWWGHRIPAYYCDDCGHLHVSAIAPEKCEKCSSVKITQDKDVLDTWFSSALWPFSTLGWPDKTPELDYFYPTNVLVTGYDILFFWVVRMIFSGIEQMDEVPFKDVLFHGLVRDSDGRKMSKSLGNGIDPLEVIDQYGADALRFMLATGNSPGNDMRYQEEKIEAARNFANKLWNASRFVLMGLDEGKDLEFDGSDQLDLSDKWILSRLNNVTAEIKVNLDKYELGLAATKLYDFTWNEYCGWYIELAKKRLYGEDEKAKLTVQRVLITVLKDILRLLHPFMPFITEEIWTYIPNTKSLLVNDIWPVCDDSIINIKAEKEMTTIMEAIKSLRNVRAEMDVIPSRKAKCIVIASDKTKKIFEENGEYLITLASCSEVVVENDRTNIPDDAVSVVVEGAELFLPLADLIDFAKEIERLEKEKKKLESEVMRVEKKLSNKGFVAKAPDKLIEEEKAKQEKYNQMLKTVVERIDSLKEKLK